MIVSLYSPCSFVAYQSAQQATMTFTMPRATADGFGRPAPLALKKRLNKQNRLGNSVVNHSLTQPAPQFGLGQTSSGFKHDHAPTYLSPLGICEHSITSWPGCQERGWRRVYFTLGAPPQNPRKGPLVPSISKFIPLFYILVYGHRVCFLLYYEGGVAANLILQGR